MWNEGREVVVQVYREEAGIRAGVTAENREVSVAEQCLIDEPGLGGVGDSLEGKVEGTTGLGGNGGGLRWRDVEERVGCR